MMVCRPSELVILLVYASSIDRGDAKDSISPTQHPPLVQVETFSNKSAKNTPIAHRFKTVITWLATAVNSKTLQTSRE